MSDVLSALYKPYLNFLSTLTAPLSSRWSLSSAPREDIPRASARRRAVSE
ncbi:hypothetical protein X777_01725 [Ooceraea biroi]|uniref:Uncharacterized protein n=1 Tax=Ooceraea biroi TaxID=2015173 RepID=A0A026WPW9_OOCBI|nr:hypothetical protein X777_01725 [Ooceraea biroi]